MSGSRQTRLRLNVLCMALLVASLTHAQEAPRRWITDVEDKQTLVEKVYPHSYALLVGINRYTNVPANNLHYAINDITELKQQLTEHYGFPEKNITLLADEKATRQAIQQALGRLADSHKIHEDDRVLVYFSGHGQTMKLPSGGQMGFLIPSDALIDLSDSSNLEPYLNTCVSMRDVWDRLDACSARHVLLIADSCYSGLLATQKGLKGLSAQALVSWQSMRARQVMTAGGQGEESEEQSQLGHGAFTYKLLEELKRRAATPGTVFLTSDLYGTLVGPVKDVTEGRQTPQLAKYHEEGEFLFITTDSGPKSGPIHDGKVDPGSTKALLMVTTDPPGATVYVDRKAVGKTPLRLPIRLGLKDTQNVVVGIALSGYDAQKFMVTLRSGVETTIPQEGGVVTLEKLPEPILGSGPHEHHDSDDDKVGHKLGDVKVNDKDGAEMVYVPAGEFQMGDDQQRDNRRHLVKLSGYWVYKNLVTVKQYKAFCSATGHSMPPEPIYHGNNFNPGWSLENHPIANVSWDDAKAYCTWAGMKLPSEAQWEKAARGAEGRKYPWGNVFDPDKLRCSKKSYGDAGGTTPAGHYPEGVSSCGALDMAGNVWQWCEDWYEDGYWRSAYGTDPTGPSTGNARCLRGGSWNYFDPDLFRCTYRGSLDPEGRDGGCVGLRCAR